MATIASPGIDTEKQTGERDDLIPLYRCVLLDDDEHTYDYVVEMMQKLFVKTKEEAFRHAVEVDTFGRTNIVTCEKPQAEFARDQIHAFGADPRMPESKGSMSAIVEPASKAEV